MIDYPVELVNRVLDGRLRKPAGASDQSIRRIVTDTRQVEPGDLFFALSGERFDAHHFVADAFARGAVAVVVNPEKLAAAGKPVEGTLIEVADPLLSLGQLATWHRNRFKVRVVAVTGSVGKTTTKDLIAGVLAQQYTTLKSPGNLNAEIGLPLTLFQLNAKHDVAVVELAMRGPGQIRYLARIARPDIAVITNIGLSHLELLGSQEAIAEAKAELLDFLPNGGTAVLNADDPFIDFLKSRVPAGTATLTFGIDRGERQGVSGSYLGPGTRADERGPDAPIGSRFTIRIAKGLSVRWSWIPLLGRHNVRNALAAAAVGQALDVSPLRINRGLAEAEISGMRMAMHRLADGSVLLDDAYNASSPEAMLAALDVLKEMSGLRKIAILGNMLELGAAAEEAHRRVGEAAAALQPECLVTVGDLAKGVAESARSAGLSDAQIEVCEKREEVLGRVSAHRRPGDIILVKGSRGMALESVVRELRENVKA